MIWCIIELSAVRTAPTGSSFIPKLAGRKVKVTNMKTVTKDMIISDILALDPGTAEFFFEIGMHCLGCPSASGESVEDACAIHGADPDQLVQKINDYLAGK